MKVFLSYGHDHNAPLVAQITRDLQAAGHVVWIDTAEIKAGDQWRRSIVDGLSNTDWTLGFLSRHSTRQPGVCLDELAIALHVKGGTIATILLEAEKEVSPPISVSHIQWLDMHDWAARQAAGDAAWYQDKIAEILALLASPTTQHFAGEIENLDRLLKPITQEADIGQLADGFVGRQWLRDRLETWRRVEVHSRLFWLTGAPGSGKSAFAAWLAHHGKVMCSASTCAATTSRIGVIRAVCCARSPFRSPRACRIIEGCCSTGSCGRIPTAANSAGKARRRCSIGCSPNPCASH